MRFRGRVLSREKPTIRLALEHDAVEISRIHITSRAAYYGELVSRAADEAEHAARWRRWLRADDRKTFVACRADALVGFVSMRERTDVHEVALVGLYVLPTEFGSGAAAVLYGTFTRLVGGRGATLEVWEANERAKAFYRRRGWSATTYSREGPANIPFITMRLAPGGE